MSLPSPCVSLCLSVVSAAASVGCCSPAAAAAAVAAAAAAAAAAVVAAASCLPAAAAAAAANSWKSSLRERVLGCLYTRNIASRSRDMFSACCRLCSASRSSSNCCRCCCGWRSCSSNEISSISSSLWLLLGLVICSSISSSSSRWR